MKSNSLDLRGRSWTEVGHLAEVLEPIKLVLASLWVVDYVFVAQIQVGHGWTWGKCALNHDVLVAEHLHLWLGDIPVAVVKEALHRLSTLFGINSDALATQTEQVLIYRGETVKRDALAALESLRVHGHLWTWFVSIQLVEGCKVSIHSLMDLEFIVLRDPKERILVSIHLLPYRILLFLATSVGLFLLVEAFVHLDC